MIIEHIKITNFRVFKGEHNIDLAPRVRYNKKRPIILFGGLNGAGKTTTLTAVRLTLYGKQSLGKNISSREYEEYLSKSIYRPPNGCTQASNASIELSFSYASMGITKHYTIERSWHKKGKGFKETISITEDGHHLSELNTEQCQGFMNELIPIGVSDLFFFDGEKIAELAEDTKGAALGDSIKKLLGLDLIETLDVDLGILLREMSKHGSSDQHRQNIEQLEVKLKTLEDDATRELTLFEQAKPKELEAKDTIAKLEYELSSRGGAWAATREEAIQHQAELSEEKRLIEKSLRELIEDQYPLSLAEDFAKKTLKQLNSEALLKRATHVARIVTERLDALSARLSTFMDGSSIKHVQNMIEEEFRDVVNPKHGTEIIHDVSDSSLNRIEAVINNALNNQRTMARELSERLSEINEELDKAGNNIARAPHAAQIKPLLDLITKAHEARIESRSKQKVHIENHKRFLREALTISRQLEKETSLIVSDNEHARAQRYATKSRSLLRDFSSEMAKRKVLDLENEFASSFHQLARKEDIDLHASIDPTTFTVTLHRKDGTDIDKDELSAGEKQIYAISILEALARTSGRHLPIIIDTPLGRLDSIHRSKLINNYFPTASHQVIILSTDTEVDEDFYSDLSPNISHAFKLDYDTHNGCTHVKEGYFWRERQTEAKAS